MKKMIAAAVVGLASVLLISGCIDVKDMDKAIGEASRSDETSSLGLRICQNKTTQKDVLETIGAPSMTFANDKGGSSWVYARVAVRNTKSGEKASDNCKAFFPFKAVKLSGDAGSRGASCKTASLTINFNKSGNVVNYEYSETRF